MHDLLHLAILASTLLGAAGLVLLVVWPLVSDTPLSAAARWGLGSLVALGLLLLVVEWRFVH